MEKRFRSILLVEESPGVYDVTIRFGYALSKGDALLDVLCLCAMEGMNLNKVKKTQVTEANHSKTLVGLHAVHPAV
jgi:hypothetical protein